MTTREPTGRFPTGAAVVVSLRLGRAAQAVDQDRPEFRYNHKRDRRRDWDAVTDWAASIVGALQPQVTT